ncbi:MAG: hypothetical protein MI702_09115, partial [Chlorobiales bacterium]|nr:hypothetical protein [Chlorobiales bacterium]
FTIPTMYIVPAVTQVAGWGVGWRILSPGSIIAAAAIWRLEALKHAQQSPESVVETRLDQIHHLEKRNFA